MAWGQICNLIHELKPVMVMVLVQIAFAGVNVVYKLAASDGMSLQLIVAYRFIFASAFMIPFALILERKSTAKVTWTVIFQSFMSGLFGGSLCQNLYLEGLYLTSATQTAAIMNLVPAFTFVLAVFFCLEKLTFKTLPGKSKVLGTIIGITGAMLLTFYKGVKFNIGSTHIDLLNSHDAAHMANNKEMVLGSALAVAGCLSFAFWLIIQAKLSEKFPCPYYSTALMCVMASVQSVVYALCMERDFDKWKLGWNVRLLTVAYSGIVGSGLIAAFMFWCVRVRGPLFVSAFNPIMLILVAIAGYFVLDEKLYLGSIIGAALIICGLYLVLWGKAKEMKKMSQLIMPSIISSSESETNAIEIVICDAKEGELVTKNQSKVKNDEMIIEKRKETP